LTNITTLKNFFYTVLAVIVLGYFTYKIFKRSLTGYLLRNNAIITKAIVINEKNYPPNQSVKPEFSYSYEFTVNGLSYTNNTHDTQVKPGDTVEVEYVKKLPSLNKPLHPKY
jgi:hypothetical protein